MVQETYSMELKKYSTHICSEVEKCVSKSVSELAGVADMLVDMEKIVNELNSIVFEKERVIAELSEKNRSIESEVAKLRVKDEEYSRLAITSVKVAEKLNAVENLMRELEEKETELQTDREMFETEKKEIITERDNAVEQANKYKEEKNIANISRDTAIKEKEDAEKEIESLISSCKKYETEIANLEYEINNKKTEISDYDKLCNGYKQDNNELQNKIKQLEESNDALKEDVQWYKEYAASLDKKIIGHYEETDTDSLPNHFYNYLNNPYKLYEIREHFPEFKAEDTEKADEEEADQAAENEEAENSYRPVQKADNEYNTSYMD